MQWTRWSAICPASSCTGVSGRQAITPGCITCPTVVSDSRVALTSGRAGAGRIIRVSRGSRPLSAEMMSKLESTPSGQSESASRTRRWATSRVAIVAVACSRVVEGATVAMGSRAMSPAVSPSVPPSPARTRSRSRSLMVSASPPSMDGTTTVWIECEAIVAATTGNRCSAPHITTPGRMASLTVVWASEERRSV